MMEWLERGQKRFFRTAKPLFTGSNPVAASNFEKLIIRSAFFVSAFLRAHFHLVWVLQCAAFSGTMPPSSQYS